MNPRAIASALSIIVIGTSLGLILQSCPSPGSTGPEPAIYRVTFDSDSATVLADPSTKTVVEPATMIDALPSAPKRTGYAFGGWWTGRNGLGTAFTATTKVAADITVYAYWVAGFAVNFDSQSATVEASPPIEVVTPPVTTVGTLPAPPLKTGYFFGGWWTQPSGGGTEFTAATIVSGDITVYAFWAASLYTVAFDSQSATVPALPSTMTVTAPATTIAALPVPPTRTGSAFGGWWTQPSGGGTAFTAATTVSGNITVYARWDPGFSVTYYANGGAGLVPVDSAWYGQGQPVHVLDNSGPLSLSGCVFAGWMTKSDGTGTSYAPNSSLAMGTEDVTMYAVWIPSNLYFFALNNTISVTGAYPAPTGTLTIPDGVTEISTGAFINSSGLTGVSIPASVSSMDANAFAVCPLLTTVTVSPSNKNYSTQSGIVFNKAGTVIVLCPGGFGGSYTIPSGVATIESGAFAYCGNLTSVDIPSSVTSIVGKGPFEADKSLAGINVNSANPAYKSVSGVLFNKAGTTLIQYPAGLAGSYVIPAGVNALGDSAFAWGALTAVNLPSSLTGIFDWAFFCSHLVNVTIPSTVSNIHDYAFYGCPNLTSVTMLAASPPVLGSLAMSSFASSFYIHVPSAAAVTAYKNAPGWTSYASKITYP